MSSPANATAPESGAISPVSWPIRVVLPAPFGPMIACNSPAGTDSVMASEASTPPKRLVMPSMARSVSATADFLQQAVDAAAREQHDQQQHGSEDQRPVFL